MKNLIRVLCLMLIAFSCSKEVVQFPEEGTRPRIVSRDLVEVAEQKLDDALVEDVINLDLLNRNDYLNGRTFTNPESIEINPNTEFDFGFPSWVDWYNDSNNIEWNTFIHNDNGTFQNIWGATEYGEEVIYTIEDGFWSAEWIDGNTIASDVTITSNVSPYYNTSWTGVAVIPTETLTVLSNEQFRMIHPWIKDHFQWTLDANDECYVFAKTGNHEPDWDIRVHVCYYEDI